ncbi:hypothetical protein E2C01_080561 [Portunus trituberculatus]|uniref:Uncharacterized protein n=1 Tax=Portunus trituberculatus TaxID=210409 RepID=A0A5B7IUE0_PORTR|nr:hypothetical protein [Portunus trituberculatus]
MEIYGVAGVVAAAVMAVVAMVEAMTAAMVVVVVLVLVAVLCLRAQRDSGPTQASHLSLLPRLATYIQHRSFPCNSWSGNLASPHLASALPSFPGIVHHH